MCERGLSDNTLGSQCGCLLGVLACATDSECAPSFAVIFDRSTSFSRVNMWSWLRVSWSSDSHLASFLSRRPLFRRAALRRAASSTASSPSSFAASFSSSASSTISRHSSSLEAQPHRSRSSASLISSTSERRSPTTSSSSASRGERAGGLSGPAAGVSNAAAEPKPEPATPTDPFESPDPAAAAPAAATAVRRGVAHRWECPECWARVGGSALVPRLVPRALVAFASCCLRDAISRSILLRLDSASCKNRADLFVFARSRTSASRLRSFSSAFRRPEASACARSASSSARTKASLSTACADSRSL
mmetsp:Transcript_24474/g.55172  ORF Transcript_24474/g.55172 Transcript_24474/m.55172 type:complete len:306 (-) Transcript_24474:283-1200(-)